MADLNQPQVDSEEPEYAFYDTETTGLDMAQILQIGLIATDKNLKNVGELKLDCRISPWNIPAPGALLTTHFDPDELKTRKNSHFDMMDQLTQWAQAQKRPLIFIGYNSLGYDEDVMRQGFYQNLLPPGLTTAGANGRADIMRMVQATALYLPGALTLDIKNATGTPSMTLKNVARQNGVALGDEDAHDALNDIRATAGVAEVVKKVAPQVWKNSIQCATTAGVNKFLADNDVFTYAAFKYGRAQKMGVMTSVAERKGSTMQALFDLRVDPASYMAMTAEQLKDVILTKGNPFTLVEKDAQPSLMPIADSAALLTEKDDPAVFEQRAKAIKADKNFLDNVAKAAVLARQQQEAGYGKPWLPESQIDEAVPADVQTKLDAWAKEFHDAADWKARARLADGFRARFRDELAVDPSLDRYGKFAERVIFEHAPRDLSPVRLWSMKKFIANRALNPNLDVPYMTIDKAKKELDKIDAERLDPVKGVKWAEVSADDISRLKKYYDGLETSMKKWLPHDAANNNAPAAPEEPKKSGNAGPKP